MPIYEFYCPDCHTVFSFFSSTVDTAAKPSCPKCGRPELGRRPSRFATPKGGRAEGEGEGAEEDLFGGLDESRLERAAEVMASEFEGMDENSDPDPRQMSRMLRRFSEVTGLEAGPKLQDLLARLDRGEDPDALESEFGGGEEGDEDLSELFAIKKKMLGGRAARPRVDETLHFL